MENRLLQHYHLNTPFKKGREAEDDRIVGNKGITQAQPLLYALKIDQGVCQALKSEVLDSAKYGENL